MWVCGCVCDCGGGRGGGGDFQIWGWREKFPIVHNNTLTENLGVGGICFRFCSGRGWMAKCSALKTIKLDHDYEIRRHGRSISGTCKPHKTYDFPTPSQNI